MLALPGDHLPTHQPPQALWDPAEGQEHELMGGLTSLSLPVPVRCCLGDVVQVVGAYNQCPVVRFIGR